MAAYDLSLSLDPDVPWTTTSRSLVLCTLRRYDVALASAQRALGSAPQDD